MSTQIRGLAPGDARHVAQRAAGRLKRVVAVDAGRAGLVEQDVRERVRQVARDCDEPVVRAGVDRHRAARRATVTNPCTVRSSSGPVPAVGVRNHVAPSNSSAFARSGPRVSAPQIGCPPMKRPSPCGRGADRALRRADVGDDARRRARASSTSRTTCGSSATGAATRTRSAPATASASVAAGSTASRSLRDAQRRRDRDPSRARVAPARRAASAADAPIRPVPTTVMFRSTARR